MIRDPSSGDVTEVPLEHEVGRAAIAVAKRTLAQAHPPEPRDATDAPMRSFFEQVSALFWWAVGAQG